MSTGYTKVNTTVFDGVSHSKPDTKPVKNHSHNTGEFLCGIMS